MIKKIDGSCPFSVHPCKKKEGNPHFIIRNLPGYLELIEGRQAGVCINGPSDILPAIRRIMANQDQYRINALKLHDEFKFELYHAKLSERLDAASAKKRLSVGAMRGRKH